MKIVHEEILINSGNFGKTQECTKILQEISDAISKVIWPPNSEIFNVKEME